MDVGCPNCQTEYELDDARVPDDGVTVKCTTCKHVFRVKRKSLVVTLPVKPEDERSAISPPSVHAGAPPAPSELPPPPPSREWKVRQPNGNLFSCRELTTLQKWIIEGKVGRDDEISLTGDTWKRLGNIPELASFFQIVDEAVKARAWEAQRASAPSQPVISLTPPPLPPMSAPTGEPRITDTWREPQFTARLPPAGPPPRVEVVTEPEGSKAVVPGTPNLRETLKEGQFSVPPPRPPQPPPPPASRSYEPTDSDLRRAARGGSGVGRWVPLVVVGVLVGGGAGYYWGVYEPEQAQRREEEVRKAAEAAARTLPPVQPTAPVLDAGLPVAPTPDAGEPDAGFDAGQGTPDAGAPVVDAGAPAAVVVDAGAPVVDAGAPRRVTYDGLLAQADRLRDNGRPEAALDLYGRAHEMKPDRVEPLTGRGLTLLDMGNTMVAQGVFEDALKVNDRYGPAIMGLAECLRLQNKNAKAVEFYQRYLDVSPEGSEAAVARNNIERLKK